MSDERLGTLAYIDSSAIVKLVLPEPESKPLAVFLKASQLISSRLGDIETRRSVRVAGGGKDTVERMEAVLASIDIVEITPEIASIAAIVDPSTVRTLDAIHLATAIAFKEDLHSMVVYDARLQAAAIQNGLRVENPGQNS